MHFAFTWGWGPAWVTGTIHVTTGDIILIAILVGFWWGAWVPVGGAFLQTLLG